MTSESVMYFKKLNPFVASAKYLQGVPNLNDTFTVRFVPKIDGIEFQKANNDRKMFFLNKNDIEKISVEDQTTVQSRVGFTRLLLIGIFAFAWKKRQSVPLSFLIFDYKDEFGDKQEMFIQSEDKRGFQEFTNIKYNLQKYWREAESGDFSRVVSETDKKHVAQVGEASSNVAIGCIAIIILLAVVWLVSSF